MKLLRDELRDAVCTEYAVGLLRGRARRRFAAMLERDPDLRRRLAGWEAMMPTQRAGAPLARPKDAVWRGIRRELGLPGRFRETLDRAFVWRAWAFAATALLALAVGLGVFYRNEFAPVDARMAMLTAQNGDFIAWVRVDDAGGTLRIGLKQPLAPPAGKSYELWFIGEGAKAPLSLGVGEALGGSFTVRAERRALLHQAGLLAVSLEPKGGSPTGLPTGEVLFTAKLTAG